MMILLIAWRNIWRHRMRSLVIMISVSLGLWSALLMIGLYTGMGEERVHSAIEKEISHLQIHHPEFKTEYNLKWTIPDGLHVLGQVTHDSRITAACGRTIIHAMISTATGSNGIQLNGVQENEEQAVTHLRKKITSGDYFIAGKKNPVLISEKTAKKLKLKIGAKVILTFQDADNNITAGAFRVCGLFKTTNTPYDEANVFARLSDVNALASLTGSINEIAILLNKNEDLDAVYSQLSKTHRGLSVETWKQISPETNYIIVTIDEMLYIFMGIIMIALAFGIINTMLMAIMERTREIGMLMALGMNKRKLFSMVLLETTFLVMAGCPVGLFLGWLSILYAGRHGIDLSVFSDVFSSFGYSLIIYPSLALHHYVWMVLIVGFTALFASLIPARKALRLKPAEAIRK